MAVTHVVARGEYLSVIALQHGFRDQRVIWDHPDNAALKKLRKNPNVLLAGDRIVIPDRTAGQVAAATGKVNQFQAVTDAAALNVDFENASRKPMSNRDGPLTLAGVDASGAFVKARPLQTSTDGGGRLHQDFTGPFIQRAAAT
ncbi:MAG: hypothetical protein ACJ78X_13010, partial [Myxococcales bacterium]